MNQIEGAAMEATGCEISILENAEGGIIGWVSADLTPGEIVEYGWRDEDGILHTVGHARVGAFDSTGEFGEDDLRQCRQWCV